MLCVTCGQMTAGDCTAPCDLCGRMQVVGSRYLLTHLVGFVGRVRTYNGFRFSDRQQVVCTVWQMPFRRSGRAHTIEKVAHELVGLPLHEGACPLHEWFTMKSASGELLIDIRSRESCRWLGPANGNALWDLEQISRWLFQLVELGRNLGSSRNGESFPYLRLGRLLLHTERDELRVLDPGVLRTAIYGSNTSDALEVPIPIVEDLALDPMWKALAISALQLSGGISSFGLQILGQGLVAVEKEKGRGHLADALQGLQGERESEVLLSLLGLRTVLVDAMERFRPTVAYGPMSMVPSWGRSWQQQSKASEESARLESETQSEEIPSTEDEVDLEVAEAWEVPAPPMEEVAPVRTETSLELSQEMARATSLRAASEPGDFRPVTITPVSSAVELELTKIPVIGEADPSGGSGFGITWLFRLGWVLTLVGVGLLGIYIAFGEWLFVSPGSSAQVHQEQTEQYYELLRQNENVQQCLGRAGLTAGWVRLKINGRGTVLAAEDGASQSKPELVSCLNRAIKGWEISGASRNQVTSLVWYLEDAEIR